MLAADISSTTPLFLGTTALLLYGVMIVTKTFTKRKMKGVPGPKTSPLLGNLYQVFSNKPFLTFTKWAEQFGDIFQLRLGSQRALVVNSIEAAKEILVTNGKASSGRPYFYTMSALHENERKFVFAPHSDNLLKLYRKSVLSDTRKRMESMEGIVNGEVRKMADSLMPGEVKETVVDLRSILHKVAANIAYGYSFGTTFELNNTKTDAWIQVMGEYRELLHWFRPQNFLPYSHLFLRDFTKQVDNFRKISNPLFLEGIQEARTRRMQNGDSSEKKVGLIDTILEIFDGQDGCDDDAIAILRDVMFGCTDGAFQPLSWAVLYLAQHPEIQARLHGEIDQELGDNTPTIEDRERLPYAEATIREIFRHSDITTLGIPRRLDQDATIQGKHIPKDTLVIVNVYKIHRSESHWKEPKSFNPERFFEEGSNTLRPLSDLSFLPFSTGQRSCPGQNLARHFIFLLFTRFFQCFEISQCADEPIPDMINAGGSFNPELKPFKVVIKKRS